MKNIPYVKKYNENGEPIVKKYVNLFPNSITRYSVQRGKLIYIWKGNIKKHFTKHL